MAHCLRNSQLTKVSLVLCSTLTSDGVEYLCHTCARHLCLDRIPPCSMANKLEFQPLPPPLPTFNPTEWRLISPRLAFMKIHEAVTGKQLKIYGNVVCMLADVTVTVSMLPRTSHMQTRPWNWSIDRVDRLTLESSWVKRVGESWVDRLSWSYVFEVKSADSVL